MNPTKDHTKWPVIGTVKTRALLNTPLGDIPSATYEIIHIHRTQQGPIYISNTWSNEEKQIPQAVPFSVVESFTPSKNLKQTTP